LFGECIAHETGAAPLDDGPIEAALITLSQELFMETEMLSLASFADPALAADDLLARLAWLRDIVRPRLERFLGYYRNPTTELAAVLPCPMGSSFSMRPFRQYQELGLPARITGFRRAADGAAIATGSIDIQRKEVVIENDIAWRINTLVDFGAGQLPAITSTAADPATQRRLTAVVAAILDASGGVTLLQHLLLHGAISGSAWVHLRPTAALLDRLATPNRGGGPQVETIATDNASTASPVAVGEESLDVARWLCLEVVDAVRLCPLPQVGEGVDAEGGPAYAALVNCMGDGSGTAAIAPATILDRVRSWFGRALSPAGGSQAFSFDLFGATHWQRYVGGVLSAEGPNLLGFVPFFRYENQPDPAAGTRVGPAGSGAVDTGFSDIEPLIALQDELNTRLSDRAYRVTMTSFQMYLGRGIEDFAKRPVGPGQMWATDNVQASIETFGGDVTAPSEDLHISEVRQALDKISGVSPIAAGVIRSKIGNLTSAVALRLTLIALLSRTDRKRAALTRTISAVIRQVLAVLDAAGIVPSAADDRGVDIHWPSALPDSELDQLQEAQMKVALGVPRQVVLSELGYNDLPSNTPVPPTT
jgi:hypothetical protein